MCNRSLYFSVARTLLVQAVFLFLMLLYVSMWCTEFSCGPGWSVWVGFTIPLLRFGAGMQLCQTAQWEVGNPGRCVPMFTVIISHVSPRLCIQWRWWIFCIWSECQRLRLGDDQVHESRWCQRASGCAWKSQVQLYGLDPWWEGNVLQCIPPTGWEKWW